MALSPLGYWKLNDASVADLATAADSSGNGRNGVYTWGSGSISTQTGPGGNYADFGNAAGTYVSIADNAVWSVDNASGLTVFVCIKPDSVSGTTRQMIVAKGSGSAGVNYEWEIAANLAVGGRLHYIVMGGPGNSLQFEQATVLGTPWQCVAYATPDAAYNTRGALYRNSSTALTTTQGSVNNSNAYANGTSTVRIGWRTDDAAGQYWQGAIGQVAIFAGQKNATQIGTLMTAANLEGWF